jgi:uncharacterized phiE125 gp8 family phage protein
MAIEITPGDAVSAVSLADAKAYLKAIGDGEDATINMMIDAAQSKIEKATDRLLITRSCKFTADAFGNAVAIPLRPISASGVVVKYFDPTGAEQTLDSGQYWLVDRLEKPRIVPAPGLSFPATWELPGGVSVEFSAGYGDDPEDIPADLRIAVLKTVRDMWSFRGDMATAKVIGLPTGVQEIVDDYRRWVV